MKAAPIHAEFFTELLATIAAAPLEELPGLLGLLKQAEAAAWLRLQTSPSPNAQPNPERLLDVTEAATRLSVSEDYLYRNWRKLSFARKENWGLRFSEAGLNAFIRSNGHR